MLIPTSIPRDPQERHRRASLSSNVGALYALQLANYLIPLATLPYLVRRLGTEQYGRVAFAYSLTYFLVLFVDAGFNTRAARALATREYSPESTSGVFAATQWIRLSSVVLSLVILVVIIACIPSLRDAPAIYLASFMTVVGSLFFPTWLFQGLEIMRFTTVCSVTGRLLVTIGIFLFVREPSDAVLAALLQCSATFLSGLLALPIIFGRLHLTLFPPRAVLRQEILAAWRESRSLAVSEYLSNALTNSGVFVLGIFHSKALVGSFAAVEKLARAGASGFSPVLQALFPRMSGHWHRDPVAAASYARRWSLRIGGVAIAGCLALLLTADWLLAILFGAAWAAQGTLLRVFAIWFVLNTVNAIVGQFWLLAPGYQSVYARCLLVVGIAQPVFLIPAAAMAGPLGAASALVGAEALASLLLWRAAWRIHGRAAT